MNTIVTILKKRSIHLTVLRVLILALLLIQLGIYWKDYSRPFRKDFMYNLYYHSQWVMPEHIQSIGDDGLYQVAGDQLLQKHNFFEVNPEVPPLGKYYYGYSIRFLGSAERGALLLFLSTALLFYFLVRIFVKDHILQAFAVLFFVTDPLLFYQSRVSMLDLPQLTALLAHVFFMIKILNAKFSAKKSYLLLLALSGITLGSFVSIKIGALGIVVILADVIILLKKKSIVSIFPILFLAWLTYISTYAMYFVQGHNIIEWLKAQKWMLHFYSSSLIQPVYGTVFTTLLTGKIIGWDAGATWAHVSEWTISWTVFFVSTVIILASRVKKMLFSDNETLYLSMLIAGLLAGYTILPFFTRYLVLVIPLLLIFVFHQLSVRKKMHNVVYLSLIALFAVHYYMFWY